MDTSSHDFGTLFKQLGLPDSSAAINRFCSEHSLPPDRALADAEFWSPAQRQFLRDAWNDDADWVEIIDALAARLRH
jgi:hypothetical protein